MNPEIQKLLSRRGGGSVYDTFKALHTMASRDKKLLQGKPLGHIVKLLISIESKPGGPYYSEFRKSEKHRIDRKTNRMIERFLSVYGIRLPGLHDFLHKEKLKNEGSSLPERPAYTPAEQRILRQINVLLKRRLGSFDPEFKDRALRVVEKTIRGNPDKQMSLMPYYVGLALGKNGKGVTEKRLAALGLANVFFWTAFIIYDDFWDEDEAADPRLLPVANFFARSYTDFFGSLFGHKSRFHGFFHKLMDELDNSNAWETTHCRAKVKDALFEIPKALPRYGNYLKKYHPASGHVLAPLAILELSGFSINSIEAKQLIEYFKNYLIAMQINDDMHDWEEDLRRGHISTAVDVLLRDAGARNTIDLTKDMGELRKTFWFTTLPKLARRALRHLEASRKALESVRGLEDKSPLEYFIHYNQKIAEKALEEQRESLQFLHAYGTSHID